VNENLKRYEQFKERQRQAYRDYVRKNEERKEREVAEMAEKYAEYDKKLELVKELENKIANAENEEGLLYIEHVRRQRELRALLTPKLVLYRTLKSIDEHNSKYKPEHAGYWNFYERHNGEIVLHQCGWSMAGNPEMNYFNETGEMMFCITTGKHGLTRISFEEARDKLMSGEGFYRSQR